MNISDICASIQDIVYRWTGSFVSDPSMNLFDKSLAIRTADFLYVFTALEKEFSVPAFNFLNEKLYTDFNINGLSEYIYHQLNNNS